MRDSLEISIIPLEEGQRRLRRLRSPGEVRDGIRNLEVAKGGMERRRSR